MGGEQESWDILIFWETGEIHGLLGIKAFTQSSQEWNEQGQEILTWPRAGCLWSLTCQAGRLVVPPGLEAGWAVPVCFVGQLS